MPEAKYMKSDQRRAVTVEAVLALAASQNPGDITTAAVAKHMGVTQGALFRHFPSKEALLQTVMEWVAKALLARLDEAAREASHALEALPRMFLAHAEFIAKHPGVPRLLFGELQHSKRTAPKRLAETLLRNYGERLQLWIERGKKAGQLDETLDGSAAAALFIGMIQGLVMQALLAEDVERIRLEAPKILAIYLRGISRRSE